MLGHKINKTRIQNAPSKYALKKAVNYELEKFGYGKIQGGISATKLHFDNTYPKGAKCHEIMELASERLQQLV